MLCTSCGSEFELPRGPGRPRKRCFECRPRQAASAPAASKVTNCAQCGGSFDAKRSGMKFCSPRCKAYWWYKWCDSDPVRRTEDRKRQAKYRASKAAAPTSRACPICAEAFSAVGIQTYCSAPCRQAARNIRRREAADPIAAIPHAVGALVSRNGAMAWVSAVVRCERWAGVIAFCPECHDVLGCASQEVRVCPSCATEVRLNIDELAIA